MALKTPMISLMTSERHSMHDRLRNFLDARVEKYNRPEFITDDPISIPHQFTRLQDIEIAGFFAAIFAWGKRQTIINKGNTLMELMDHAPHDFCLHHSEDELRRLAGFAHRTFNESDLLYSIEFLKHHYQRSNSLEDAFFTPAILQQEHPVEHALNHFYDYFFSLPYVMDRTRKHIAAPKKNSACKRLNMFLRWMVRRDGQGVDFGIWKKISPAHLVCPLDVHVERVARNLHLLEEKKSGWNAALELTENLKKLDAADPVKYDFALFGLGIIEKY